MLCLDELAAFAKLDSNSYPVGRMGLTAISGHSVGSRIIVPGYYFEPSQLEDRAARSLGNFDKKRLKAFRYDLTESFKFYYFRHFHWLILHVLRSVPLLSLAALPFCLQRPPNEDLILKLFVFAET